MFAAWSPGPFSRILSLEISPSHEPKAVSVCSPTKPSTLDFSLLGFSYRGGIFGPVQPPPSLTLTQSWPGLVGTTKRKGPRGGQGSTQHLLSWPRGHKPIRTLLLVQGITCAATRGRCGWNQGRRPLCLTKSNQSTQFSSSGWFI